MKAEKREALIRLIFTTLGAIGGALAEWFRARGV